MIGATRDDLSPQTERCNKLVVDDRRPNGQRHEHAKEEVAMFRFERHVEAFDDGAENFQQLRHAKSTIAESRTIFRRNNEPFKYVPTKLLEQLQLNASRCDEGVLCVRVKDESTEQMADALSNQC